MKTQDDLLNQTIISLCYIAFTFISLFFIIAIAFDKFTNLLYLIAVPSFISFLFAAIGSNSFQHLRLLLDNYNKYRKIYPFLTHQQQVPYESIKQFQNSDIKNQKKTFRNSRESMIVKRYQQKQKEVKVMRKKSKEIGSPDYERDRKNSKRSYRDSIDELQTSYSQHENDFLTVRQNHKKYLLNLSKKYGFSLMEFDNIVRILKQDYCIRIQKILARSEKNTKDLIDLLQKNYEVKVMTEKDNQIQNKSIMNAHIDEVYVRVSNYQIIRAFPWNQRTSQNFDFNQSSIAKELQNIVKDQALIDRYLSPYAVLNHQARTYLISDVRTQLKENRGERELLYIAARLYNDLVKDQNPEKAQKYLILRQGSIEGQCLQIVESRVRDNYHADLVKKRLNKKQNLPCMPGQNNIWNLIALAFQIYKYKQ